MVENTYARQLNSSAGSTEAQENLKLHQTVLLISQGAPLTKSANLRLFGCS